MDLQSVLNTSDNVNREAPKSNQTTWPLHTNSSRTTSNHTISRSPRQTTGREVLETQSGASYPPSPSKPAPRDYPNPEPHQNVHQQQYSRHPHPHPHPQSHQHPYIIASPLHPHSSAPSPGQYHGRPPATVALQVSPGPSARSPGVGSMSAPTTYRTPGILPPSTTAYGFPQARPAPDSHSPISRQQLPSPATQQQYASGRPTSFSQQSPVLAPGPYVQQQQHASNSPPGSHHYARHRSQSAQSTPTPTSAHSHSHYGFPQQAHGSPTASSDLPPAVLSRRSSQQPAPLIQTQMPEHRHQVVHQPSIGGSAQASSPYQHRLSLTASPQTLQPQPPLHILPRNSIAPPAHESVTSESSTYRLSIPGREHSMSVSPKTQFPSLPMQPIPQPEKASPALSATAKRLPRTPGIEPVAITPAKRKLEQSDISPVPLSNKRPIRRDSPQESNGEEHSKFRHSPEMLAGPNVRKRRAHTPPWAVSMHSLGNTAPGKPNFVLQSKPAPIVNGALHDGKKDKQSRNTTPEVPSSQSSKPTQPAQPAVLIDPGPKAILGQWEASISGVKPYEEVAKSVADFLFINVLGNSDFQEITSRRILFEIEAKLGTLVDKDTNHRVEKLVRSECVLQDTGRTAFKSSMTEAHHKAFNDFLNHLVYQTTPKNPDKEAGRVTINYNHTREIDRFFDLPLEPQSRLPGCMRARLSSRTKSARVRVTYDQKSHDVLKKIVKARIADLDIHMPSCPMDCRISVNLEMDWDGSVEELETWADERPAERQPDRNKDRLSYTQGHYQVDLTQVTQTHLKHGVTQRLDKEHELEIELASDMMIEQGRRATNNEPHRYQELIEGFVDNIRVLARKAREFVQ